VCKVVFDEVFSSLPLFKRFGCALFKQNLSLSLCSRYFGYAFKAKPSLPPSLPQNLHAKY